MDHAASGTILLPGDRLAEIVERDSDEHDKGKTVRRVRVADTLRRMEMAGTIDAEQKRAGDEFRNDFQFAHLDGIKPRSMERIDLLWNGGPELSRVEHAKRRIFRDLEAMGGVGRITSSIVWDVVGRELTIKQWCEDQYLIRRRAMNPKVATGILIAGLCVIVQTRNI